ncbi:MAG TPA: hypothetical protein VKZ99_08075 [Gammaproteobacteria bacterium]|nr:hypothetical protein [Gammaproteobacteria bacterium]
MMHSWLFALLLAEAAAPSPLQAFDFLAGKCWQGSFENGAVDTRCVRWMYEGSHLRDVHVVRGADGDYCGETIYSVDGETAEVVFRYFNSLGGVGEGRMHSEGGVLVAPETYTGKDGRRREFRSTLKPLAEDRYEALTQEQVNGEWRTMMRIEFGRIDDAEAEAILRNACGA